ncbi:glycosyltransferase family 2 protein [Nocardia sp. 348MFTsu5.1]|uniref:glycosyltransferase n=1 Tax=Nocardia sp. 348MFTsu5.1 TaxID=1172185 RepID=UPI000379FC61|nr:glycosyltransferase family 2 protein [Nocardia sp. 348MFTsu5.1]
MRFEKCAYNVDVEVPNPCLPAEPTRAYVVALIAAHREEAEIGNTIRSLLAQHRPPNKIVVITNRAADKVADRTHQIAESFPEVTAIDLVFPTGTTHGKSRALNHGWLHHARLADIVVCIDADTRLPQNAVGDWVGEFYANPRLGGSSSKFTMRDERNGDQAIVQVQRAEFARWTDTSLRRGWTSVLAGTGCAIRGVTLVEAATTSGHNEGPWCYASMVEDFELTYRLRAAGYLCQVSPTVRAYTDAMKGVRSLWSQRMKWQSGTVSDLMKLGFNRLTALDWMQQFAGFLQAFVRIGWPLALIASLALGTFEFRPIWLLCPVYFAVTDWIMAARIPHRTWRDRVTALALVPQDLFAYMRAGWFIYAWIEALSGSKKDRWSGQYQSEGV